MKKKKLYILFSFLTDRYGTGDNIKWTDVIFHFRTDKILSIKWALPTVHYNFINVLHT